MRPPLLTSMIGQCTRARTMMMSMLPILQEVQPLQLYLSPIYHYIFGHLKRMLVGYKYSLIWVMKYPEPLSDGETRSEKPTLLTPKPCCARESYACRSLVRVLTK